MSARNELIAEAIAQCESIASAMQAAADDADAEQRLYEIPLAIEVRSGWYTPGDAPELEEFRVVLCTGGPRVELRGEIDHHGEPHKVRVAARDWGLSIEDVAECRDYSDTLLSFAQRLIAV